MAGGGSSKSIACAASRQDVASRVAERQPCVKVSTLPRHISWRKRAFDLVVGGGLLLALLPLLTVTWIAVRLTSQGPGLYWSERVGFRGQCFYMPKFRTMRCGAPVLARESLAEADAHITPLGHVLRRFSIDETPQLLCVLSGHMSLIGPRPLLPNDPAQAARARFPDVMLVRPGLSGLSQVRGRNHIPPRRKARLDAFYARQRSWKLDVAILLSTAAVVLTGRGMM